VEPEQHIEHIRIEGRWFGEAARECPLGLAVPTCPSFDVADLIWHVGVVHNFWAAVVSGRLGAPDEVDQPSRPHASDLWDFYDLTFERLLLILADADPTAHVWTPTAQRNVRFVDRRVAHETAIHRCDLELTSGHELRPVDSDLAEDGIDEWVNVVLQSRPDRRIDLEVDPTGRGWTLGEGGLPSAVVRGKASDLLLALWRRKPIERLHIEGDRESVIGFLGEAAFF
jgi:uncharacterized protein (TIGR03083 family)